MREMGIPAALADTGQVPAMSWKVDCAQIVPADGANGNDRGRAGYGCVSYEEIS
jgi:hypothetical protein